jgi:hypothetical protein
LQAPQKYTRIGIFGLKKKTSGNPDEEEIKSLNQKECTRLLATLTLKDRVLVNFSPFVHTQKLAEEKRNYCRRRCCVDGSAPMPMQVFILLILFTCSDLLTANGLHQTS